MEDEFIQPTEPEEDVSEADLNPTDATDIPFEEDETSENSSPSYEQIEDYSQIAPSESPEESVDQPEELTNQEPDNQESSEPQSEVDN